MIRFLIGLVLLACAVPYIYLAGLGFYYGLDVMNGVRYFTLGIVDRQLVYTGNERVDASELETANVDTRWQGKLDNEQLTEASGLAFGNRSDVLFSINDSGNAPELFALGTDGRDLGVWSIDYPGMHDFEDLASFELDGEAYLLVADTGDNFNWRPHLVLFAIPEPDLDSIGEVLVPSWTTRFRFAEGYRDIEGVAVDEKEEAVYLISKRRIPAEMFRVPLKSEEIATAAKVATMRGIPKPTDRDLREDSKWGESSSSPTAFDLQGRSAMVVTYKEAYLYRRPFRTSWDEVFKGLPIRVPLPEIWGLESGAFDPTADVFYVTGEREDGVGAMDVFEVRLP